MECTVVNKNRGRCEMLRQDTKEAMIYINNKYGFIEFTKLCQINHYFSYLSTKKTSCVTGRILNWGAVRSSILHTLTQDAVSLFYIRI